MTRGADVFPVICPSEGPGTGLAPACWPDQKPVHPTGCDPSQFCRARFHAPDRHRDLSPNLLIRTETRIRSGSSTYGPARSYSKPPSEQTLLATGRRCDSPSSMLRAGARSPSKEPLPSAPVSPATSSSVASRCSRSAGSAVNGAPAARPMPSTRSARREASSVRSDPRCRGATESVRRYARSWRRVKAP